MNENENQTTGYFLDETIRRDCRLENATVTV